mgnify:CR=1 FL=1
MEKYYAAVLGGFLVPAFEFFYGTGDIVKYTMAALVFFIALDWIAGIRASKKDGSYASKYGIDGVFRTFFIILLPAGGNLLDMIVGSPGFIFGVFQSMTANSIRAGWGQWVPDWILTKLTDWVKSEIESKLSRSTQRLNQRDKGESVNE